MDFLINPPLKKGRILLPLPHYGEIGFVTSSPFLFPPLVNNGFPLTMLFMLPILSGDHQLWGPRVLKIEGVIIG